MKARSREDPSTKLKPVRTPPLPPEATSPWRLLVTTLLAVCTAEALVMLLLPGYPPMMSVVKAVVDPLLLCVVTFPVLYFTMYRPLSRRAEEIKRASVEMQRNYDTQVAINSLLRLALEDLPLELLLGRALDLVLSIPWLSVQKKGAIFLIEDRPDVLVMKCQVGLTEPQQQMCAEVPFGKCLCGQAAASLRTLFADGLDGRHDKSYEGILPHGHLCVPIIHANQPLGLVNMYLASGHTLQQTETNFVEAVANILAGILVRRQADEALRFSNQQLHETQQGAIQQERLSALGTMASGVAHNFDNALTSILGFSRTLLGNEELLEDKELLKESLQVIETVSEDAASAVDGLRVFNRPVDASDELRPIELNPLIEQVVEMTRPKWEQARTKGVRIDLQLDLGPLPAIKGSESELRQSLINLIFNATDAIIERTRLSDPKRDQMGKGIIRIATHVNGHTGDGSESGGLDTSHSCVALEISDDGIGMEEEVRRRCLDPFFTTKGESGSGLGLAGVYGAVQRHGGTVDIESERGKGTVFRLSFPIEMTRQDTAG